MKRQPRKEIGEELFIPAEFAPHCEECKASRSLCDTCIARHIYEAELYAEKAQDDDYWDDED